MRARLWQVGDLVSADPAEIVIDAGGGRTTFLRADVTRFEKRTVDRSPAAGAGRGLLIGAGVGALAGFLAASDDPPGLLSFSKGDKTLMLAGAFGVVGLVLGAVTSGDTWVDARGSSGVHLYLDPVRGVAGLTLNLPRLR